jgi:hypothetical protein
MPLTKEQIQSRPDVITELVPCPEWNGEVLIRNLSGKELDAYEQSNFEVRGKKVEVNVRNARARLVVMCAVDETGRRLFELTDADWLGNKNGLVLDRLYEVAARLSGIRKQDIEDLQKNLGSGQSAASGSALPSNGVAQSESCSSV